MNILTFFGLFYYIFYHSEYIWTRSKRYSKTLRETRRMTCTPLRVLLNQVLKLLFLFPVLFTFARRSLQGYSRIDNFCGSWREESQRAICGRLAKICENAKFVSFVCLIILSNNQCTGGAPSQYEARDVIPALIHILSVCTDASSEGIINSTLLILAILAFNKGI